MVCEFVADLCCRAPASSQQQRQAQQQQQQQQAAGGGFGGWPTPFGFPQPALQLPLLSPAAFLGSLAPSLLFPPPLQVGCTASVPLLQQNA
jgi:hypothetical protein